LFIKNNIVYLQSKTNKMIKHTLQNVENHQDIMRIIMNNNLDIRIEFEYDFEETNTILLIGDEDHISYLVNECL